jgi:RNA polymerase sigma-70 factor (ECF subfamily)
MTERTNGRREAHPTERVEHGADDRGGAEQGMVERFEAHRASLRALAYRMLGSVSEADDAVQDAWLRLRRADPSAIANLEGWLTTVVARLCLDALRTRASRREEPLDAPTTRSQHPPRPMLVAQRADGGDPEHEAQLADAVGLALLVVLDRLAPAERVAFVLHDAFDLPFDAIAEILDRSPAAARQLASRARRRLRGSSGPGSAARSREERARQRRVVEAYLTASRAGDLAALLRVLAPGVVLRADRAAMASGAAAEVRGADAVAQRALVYGSRAPFSRMALVDGAVGLVVAPRGRLLCALALRIEGERIVGIDVIMERERLARLDLAVLDPA